MFMPLALAPPPQQPNPYLEPASIIAYVAIGIAIIGTIIMWQQLHYGKRRQYKEFTYSKLVDTPLISVDTRDEREKIQIFYDKHEVNDMYLALLKRKASKYFTPFSSGAFMVWFWR